MENGSNKNILNCLSPLASGKRENQQRKSLWNNPVSYVISQFISQSGVVDEVAERVKMFWVQSPSELIFFEFHTAKSWVQILLDPENMYNFIDTIILKYFKKEKHFYEQEHLNTFIARQYNF